MSEVKTKNSPRLADICKILLVIINSAKYKIEFSSELLLTLFPGFVVHMRSFAQFATVYTVLKP